MKAIAINGSPRKGWNTHLLLERALEGAAAEGAQPELIHLHDLHFEGCRSCLSCKLKESTTLGSCAINDDLKPVLESIDTADLLIVGSPIYFNEVTGQTRMFIERLLFQDLSYDAQGTTLGTKKRVPVLLVYTMNMPSSALDVIGQTQRFESYEQLFGRFLGPAKSILATETLQTNHYEKYHMAMFDVAMRQKRREAEFAQTGQKAYDFAAAILRGEIDTLPSEVESAR